MTLTKDKKTGVYKARVHKPDGSTATLSTKAKSKAEAKRVVKQSRLAEIEEAAKVGRLNQQAISYAVAGRVVKFPDAIKEYVEWMKLYGKSAALVYHTEAVLNRFMRCAKIEKLPIPSVTDRMISEFINDPSETKGVNWRKNQLSMMNGFFAFCSAKGWVMGNPAGLVRVRMDLLSHAQKEPRSRAPFTDGEIRSLLAYFITKRTESQQKRELLLGKKRAPLTAREQAYLSNLDEQITNLTFWQAAIALGRYAGLRFGDIAQLEWDCIAVPGKLIVWTEKRDRRVELPFEPQELIDAMASIPPTDPQYIFPEKQKIAANITQRANLATEFRRHCERVGIKGKTFHALRHAYVSDCARRGVSIEHIAKNVGHASTLTTRGYIHNGD